MTFYYTPSADKELPLWRRSLSFGVIAGLHAIALLVAFGVTARPELARPLQALSVRMLEMAPRPPVAEPPKAKPPTPLPQRKPVSAPPVIAVAAPAPVAAPVFSVAPQNEPRPAEARPAPIAPAVAPILAARFDADYLQNPKPVYPAMSRRLGEEGKVVLRVRVAADGTSLAVEIRQSSGFPRLDEAARSAVEKWRFIPARQGGEAIESSVLVPLHFTLDH